MKLYRNIAATLLLIPLVLMLPACDEEGPLEKAGEEIDEAVEDAGDSIEDATD